MKTRDYGTVQHNGKTLRLTQDAYLTCDGSTNGERWYQASAKDDDGNEYRVIWYPYADFEGEDEGDACDWESPDRIESV